MGIYNYNSATELIKILKKKNVLLHEFILKREEKLYEKKSEDIVSKLKHYLKIIKQSINTGKKNNYKSLCLNNEIKKIVRNSKKIMSPLEYEIIVSALAISINNCSMGRIIACPTAGSCGILPGTLIPVSEKYKIKNNEIINSLIVAGEVGRLIANKIGISGASGGCMAECGTASAMTASAIVYFFDKNPEKIFSAAALALKNNFGLVCDPVAGLVEVPCVKRNAIKSVESLTVAQLVISGINSFIPFDEVIEAASEVADSMPKKYKETSEGGLAKTKTAQKLKFNFQ